MRNNLKILILAAEVAPFAKAGGLADVAGALPKALKALGFDVRVAMPAYHMIEANPRFAVSEILAEYAVPVRPGRTEEAYIRRTVIPAEPSQKGGAGEIPVYLIGAKPLPGSGAPGYFERAVDSRTLYALEPEPYVFFDRAVLEWLAQPGSDWRPDIIHSNDWHCGLVPVFAKRFYADVPALRAVQHLFTIHNLAYQGQFDRDRWYVTGLDDSLYSIDGLESWGHWSFLKGALNFADHVSTVSPRYAQEIQTAEYGCMQEGMLRKLAAQGRLHGILNGIDTDVFDPTTDPNLASNYSQDDIRGKAKCKSALRQELGLTSSAKEPILGMVTRFVEQKGLDLLEAAAEQILGLGVQFAFLGLGDPRYERVLETLQERHPGRVAVRIAYDAALAQRIYAGADLFLMPSRFEPCGLGQLIALRYGALPIVRATGGLADTVTDYTEAPETGNGFAFQPYTGEALYAAVRRSVEVYDRPAERKRLVQRALAQDWSWDRSAASYASLFQSMILQAGGPAAPPR